MIKLNQFERDIELFVNEDDDDDEELKIFNKMIWNFYESKKCYVRKMSQSKMNTSGKDGKKGLQILSLVSEMFKR